ncbi:MAG: PQQ-dependent dehydrogenase, methanol/ethanol family [Sphingomonas sp.]|nr:PQQ-dependent dehydrogenase, methanol/ethanol family [Sphingomonas sp.]
MKSVQALACVHPRGRFQKLLRCARRTTIVAACAGLIALSSCAPGDNASVASGDDWRVHGGDPSSQRHSRLMDVNEKTVGQLGLAWWVDLDTDAGQEATPIMRDGTLYVISAYDVVRAVDARTGKTRWTYDPEVRAAASRSCCGPVSRGVAVEDGRVFVGALDGRLIALDSNTGKPDWQVQTIDQPHPAPVNYSITGAPRVVKGLIVIGNGGAEFGARGYVTAYDRKTGRKVWRFYTVPGKPGVKDGEISDSALAKAGSSWHGEWWRWGGGGTVWDAIEYDADLNLLYIGVGNGSPTNYGLRSEGKGDNLFLSSIVALRADTGEYVWHYQQTPGESWDYTATQNIIFADLTIAGQPRKVLMQAPKNGLFYILDRATGELISAKPFATINWTKGVDRKSGRPIVNPAAQYFRGQQPAFVMPSSGGAHNWPPMAYDPDGGLVYIPVQDMGLPFAATKDPEIRPGVYNTGTAIPGGDVMRKAELKAATRSMKGYLLAWNPVTGQAAWRREMVSSFNGGVLSTAGGLIFQGNGERKFVAYRAKNGTPLWSFDAQTGIVAPPITYRLDGVQYIAVMAGWGGAWPMLGGQMALTSGNAVGPNRLLVFRIGGKASLPRLAPRSVSAAPPPADKGTTRLIARGDGLYGQYCVRCHGIAAVSASMVPDLRRSGFLAGPELETVVLGGALAEAGMPSFQGKLTLSDLEAVRAYLIHQANRPTE